MWGRYLEILLKHGGYGFDVDYKNYDGTVQPAAFEFFLQVTDHFYGPKDRLARHSLISTLQCSYHLIGATLAESSQGNKSGNPLTDLFNSITNTWLVYVVYQITRDVNGLSGDMVNQPDDFDFLTYGDDVIIAATENCLEYFNRVSFAEVAKMVGMTVTAANKSDQLDPYESIYDLTFLKSPFVPRVGYVAAPLPKKIIYRELMWETTACVGDQTIFHERIKNALEFMAHHGEHEYQKLRLELGQLGVHTEDRFTEWENEMREKQLYPEVEDGLGRFYVESDELFLEAEPDEMELEIDWEADEWLYAVEEMGYGVSAGLAPFEDEVPLAEPVFIPPVINWFNEIRNHHPYFAAFTNQEIRLMKSWVERFIGRRMSMEQLYFCMRNAMEAWYFRLYMHCVHVFGLAGVGNALLMMVLLLLLFWLFVVLHFLKV